jgi:hypothetical protein
MYSMKRQRVAALAEVAGHVEKAGVVQAALDDGVHLHRQARGGRALDPVEHRWTGKSTSFIARNVASSSESRLTVTRSRPASRALRLRGEERGVRRQRQLGAERREQRDQALDVLADERLAAREAQLLDAERDDAARTRSISSKVSSSLRSRKR